MISITVATKAELKEAIRQKYQQIIVTGELAEKIKQVEKIKKLSKPAIATLAATCATVVASNVATKVAPPPIKVPTKAVNMMMRRVAMEVGKESGKIIITTPELIIIASIGVTILVTLFREYDCIEVGEGKVILKKTKKYE